jgi:hypothetical protein
MAKAFTMQVIIDRGNIDSPISVKTILLVTYAIRMIISEETIARGMLLLGFVASSPVVAIMSNPMNA